MASAAKSRLTDATVRALVEARHDDPFAVLGPHEAPGGVVIRALVPGAARLEVVEEGHRRRRRRAGIRATRRACSRACSRTGRPGSATPCAPTTTAARWEVHDPYRFPPVLGEMDDYLIREGTHRRLWERLGAHAIEHAGVAGVHFAVWAPNAARVSVVGDFNGWDGRRNPMRRRGGVGVWEIFIPGLGEGAVYKYELRAADGSLLPLEGRPGRHRRRAAAAERVGGPPGRRLHLERRGLARRPRRRAVGQGAGQHPRGASRLLGARRGQPLPDL